jgi:hypothetical protein
MKKNIFLFLVLALCFSSCLTIKINFGGFNELTSSERNRIVFFTDTMQVNNASDSVAIAITASGLKQYLHQFDSALVYFWDALCPSPYWKSPAIVQDYCKENNLCFVLILRKYIDTRNLYETNSGLEQPAFVIDAFPYGTNNIRKIVPKFRKELLVNIDKKDLLYGGYWLYCNGVFEKCTYFEK